MTKFVRQLVAIATIITIVCGSWFILLNSFKIIDTGISLTMISWEISDYNSDPIKTYEEAERYNELNEMRNVIYNSDGIVGWFSTQCDIVQLLFFMLGLLGLLMPFFLMAVALRSIYLTILQQKKRRRRRMQSKKVRR